MAVHGSIDSYLNELHRRVAGWHRRPDDVVAEAADHILEREAQLQGEGLGADEAARQAIAEYGTTQEVADAHLRTARRPAIPTVDTRTAGIVAMASSPCWIGLPVLTAFLPDAMPYWAVLATLLHFAVAGAGVGCVGLWMRHGRRGPLALLAAVPAVLAVPFVLFAWPIPAWMVLLGIASLLFGLHLVIRRLAPLPSTLAFTSGLALSATAVLTAEYGTTSTSEDFAFLASTAASAVVVAGMILFGVGLFGLGRWLRSEQPVEIPGLPAPRGTGQLAS